VAEESNRCHPEGNPAIHTMVGKFNKIKKVVVLQTCHIQVISTTPPKKMVRKP
jgi:hypothetical protein